MMVLRAFRYFVEEALTSLWRSRLITGLSVITIAVSLFVLGAFLSLASNLAGVVARWSDKVQVTFYLEDQLPDAARDGLQAALRADPAVESVVYISREEALRRFRALFREMRSLPEDLGENPFPAALEVTLHPARNSAADAQRLVDGFRRAPGVEDVEYDLLWIQRRSYSTSSTPGALRNPSTSRWASAAEFRAGWSVTSSAAGKGFSPRSSGSERISRNRARKRRRASSREM
ncbi:MAG: hypothetical protein DMF77_18520 [Acidobacteria bacterium]|nr:MAG: hypothetical protein DMF77_18520 [Acidobacteriota bacterium]